MGPPNTIAPVFLSWVTSAWRISVSVESSITWWLCDMTPEGDHKTAQQVFHSYLSTVDPDLYLVQLEKPSFQLCEFR